MHSPKRLDTDPGLREGDGGRRRAAVFAIARIFLPLSLLITAGLVVRITSSLEAFSNSPFPIARAEPFHPALASRPPQLGKGATEVVVDGPVPIQFTVEQGETLGQLFDSYGLSGSDARQAAAALTEHVDPRLVRAGDPYSVFLDDKGELQAFELTLTQRGCASVTREEDGDWSPGWRPFVRTQRPRFVAGEVEGALGVDIQEAGGRASLAYLMSDVLQWDLDFNRDLRRGDRFEVIYEEEYLDGEYAKVGGVVALRYENRGRVIEAYRWGEGDSYYDSDGRPMRKMFLRSPLPFSPRITSRFSHRRFHPVLKKYRPHYGVDFAAPTGTRVRATAAGTVTFAGWNRGGGKTVKVRHPRGYLTAYLHLSRIADGIRPGVSVIQGQELGRVGSTGLSTGPHLDYRVQKDNRWIDPLSLRSIPAKPISASDMIAFRRHRDALRDYLDQGVAPPRQETEGVLAAAETSGSEIPVRGSGR